MPANPSAAHVGSATQHVGCALAGVGAPSVLINGKPAWTSSMSVNCPVHGVEHYDMGSETVLVGGNRLALANNGGGVAGDFLLGAGPPNQIMTGSPNVFVGSPAFGIASEENLAAFCKSYCALRRDWPRLSPSERQRRYEAILKDQAQRAGFPEPGTLEEQRKNTSGGFKRTSWNITVPAGTWDKSHPPSGGTTTHELRHAEQSYLALRHLQGDPPWIDRDGDHVPAGPVSIPDDILEQAKKDTLDPDSPRGRLGRLHAHNEFSDAGLNNRSEVIRRITSHEQDTPEFKQAYEDYYNQPGGADVRPVEKAGNGCSC